MSVMRLKFLKGESVKYISHLDLMRTVHRVIRRAHIPVAYSNGFNPHQEISFGAPLPLGVTSEAEYVDIKLAQEIEPAALISLFNGNAPEGVRMLEGKMLEQGTKSAMALVTHSEYRLSVVLPYGSFPETEKQADPLKKNGILVKSLSKKLDAFMDQEEIPVVKFNKKTNVAKKLNVRPLVLNCEIHPATDVEAALLGSETEGAVIFSCLVKSGSTDNIKPELVAEAFGKFLGCGLTVRRIHRLELYKQTKEGLTDLFDNRYLSIKG